MQLLRSTTVQNLTFILHLSEKNPALKFSTTPDTWTTKKHVNYYPWVNASVTHIVRDLLNVCSNRATCKLQREKIQIMQWAVHISGTTETLQKGQGHQPRMRTCTPNNAITMKSSKDLPLMVSEKKSTSFVLVFKWICAIIKKGDIFMIYLKNLTILWSLNLIEWEPTTTTKG